MYTIVNIDYESYLFDPHYHENADQYTKQIREFEYVFFLFSKSDDVLIHQYDYTEEDLVYFRSLGFSPPKLIKKNRINKNLPIHYFWGDLNEKEKNQVLNSKFTSMEIGKKLGLGFYQGGKVLSINDVKTHLKKFSNIKEWILKNPFGMSGKGHYLFSRDQKIPEHIILSRPILEPLYDRVFDIGTTYIIDGNSYRERFSVVNFNDRQGQFRGGGASLNPKYISEFVIENFKLNLDDLYRDLDKVVAEYLKLNPKNNLQIDSFIYRKDDGGFSFYPLVEVNCRKTMGLVIYELANRHPDLWCEWRFNKVEEQNSIEKFKFSLPSHHHQSQVYYFNNFATNNF